jgi:hypothetical protein
MNFYYNLRVLVPDWTLYELILGGGLGKPAWEVNVHD